VQRFESEESIGHEEQKQKILLVSRIADLQHHEDVVKAESEVECPPFMHLFSRFDILG